ncbi:uncharacterized protein LOC113305089 [Papaver somniferum]|uniref:uncharacterized protein LOC113305089 n=1 Tax=Papaver somniferum TaxID=3469 RepID=UPI000E6F49DA|nr:uncharacterized protein LOC113305089 [Papaver somniferum]
MVYFNFPLSLAIVIAAWGWSVYTFDKHLVPYEHSRILDLGERTPGPVIMMSALYMSLAVGSSLTIYWALFAIGLHSLATAVPLFLYIGGLFYCLYSFWPSRDFLWTRVKRIIRRPTLADMFFADILTSFSKDLADLSTAVCSMLFAWGLYSTDLGAHESICGPHSWVAAALSASPSVFRLVQCTWLHFSPPTQELESRVLEVAPPPTWLSGWAA